MKSSGTLPDDPSATAGRTAGPAVLAEVERLYDAGRVLDALRHGESALGPVRAWPGAAGRVMAGRVAMNLGGPRLGRTLHLREHPEDPQAEYYHVRAIIEGRGPLAGVDYFRRHSCPADASPSVRADWLSLRATVAATYRDAATAEQLVAEAIELAPDRAWLRVEQAFTLEQADRFDDAMAAARLALAMHPWLRPAVQAVAHLLQVRDEDCQALELLTEAADRLQSVPLLLQLAALQDHLPLYPDALRTLARLDEMAALADRSFGKALSWVRHNVLYHAGDHAAAVPAAAASDAGGVRQVGATLAAQVEAGQTKPRVVLDAPFVRQHHMTCAPATLTALSRYWGRPADHLELVEAICYDGTPAYHQRDWAATHGWTVREFRLTWDAATALIDRGVPFTLATVAIGSAHLQAVVGYDPMRGTVLCRDPSQYYESELSVEALLTYNAAFGPHCMIMLPPEEAHRLDGLALPDAELHEGMHAVGRSLDRHDRPAAVAARDQLAATAGPDHRLALSAARAVAGYDRDAAASLAAVDALLAQFPDSRPLRLARAYDLRSLGRHQELAAELADAGGRTDAHPVSPHLYAEHLRNHGDARSEEVAAPVDRASESLASSRPATVTPPTAGRKDASDFQAPPANPTAAEVTTAATKAGAPLNAEAAAAHVRRLVAKSRWMTGKTFLTKLDATTAAWPAAAGPYLEGLAKAARPSDVVNFVRRHDAALRRSGATWGAVTYALTTVNHHRRCTAWCHDWRTRTDVQPWMLVNLASAHRRTGRVETAAAVAAHALTLPDDGHHLKHQLWLAVDELAAGCRGPATTAVLAADCVKLDRHYPFLSNVVRALDPLAESTTATPAAATRARREVAAACRLHSQGQTPGIHRVRQAAAGRIARVRPILGNRAWAWSTHFAVWFRRAG